VPLKPKEEWNLSLEKVKIMNDILEEIYIYLCISSFIISFSSLILTLADSFFLKIFPLTFLTGLLTYKAMLLRKPYRLLKNKKYLEEVPLTWAIVLKAQPHMYVPDGKSHGEVILLYSTQKETSLEDLNKYAQEIFNLYEEKKNPLSQNIQGKLNDNLPSFYHEPLEFKEHLFWSVVFLEKKELPQNHLQEHMPLPILLGIKKDKITGPILLLPYHLWN